MEKNILFTTEAAGEDYGTITWARIMTTLCVRSRRLVSHILICSLLTRKINLIGTTTPPSTSTTGFTTTEESTTSQPDGRKLFRLIFHKVISGDESIPRFMNHESYFVFWEQNPSYYSISWTLFPSLVSSCLNYCQSV